MWHLLIRNNKSNKACYCSAVNAGEHKFPVPKLGYSVANLSDFLYHHRGKVASYLSKIEAQHAF